MAVLSRAEIDKVSDAVTEEVAVPEWGGSVLLKAMSGAERDEWEASMVDHRGGSPRMNYKLARAKLVARCLVAADGKRLYSDAEIEQLGKRNGAVLDRLFAKSKELNALDKKDLDDLTKNSNAGQSEDSTSA